MDECLSSLEFRVLVWNESKSNSDSEVLDKLGELFISNILLDVSDQQKSFVDVTVFAFHVVVEEFRMITLVQVVGVLLKFIEEGLDDSEFEFGHIIDT